jgi:hypothetical protein
VACRFRSRSANDPIGPQILGPWLGFLRRAAKALAIALTLFPSGKVLLTALRLAHLATWLPKSVRVSSYDRTCGLRWSRTRIALGSVPARSSIPSQSTAAKEALLLFLGVRRSPRKVDHHPRPRVRDTGPSVGGHALSLIAVPPPEVLSYSARK